MIKQELEACLFNHLVQLVWNDSRSMEIWYSWFIIDAFACDRVAYQIALTIIYLAIAQSVFTFRSRVLKLLPRCKYSWMDIVWLLEYLKINYRAQSSFNIWDKAHSVEVCMNGLSTPEIKQQSVDVLPSEIFCARNGTSFPPDESLPT
jgi:hypothetical protein